MRISSSAFAHKKHIHEKDTCDGDNINPPLQFSVIPQGAKSLVLICDDPDASGGTWTHWTVWNMPPDTTEITEGMPPPGIEGLTGFGRPGYGGPCPPSGTHRYFFRLYALDTMLELANGADAKTILEAMRSHVMEEAELVGLYAKNKM
ncbi:MAG: YbhB/YbcL family Raf kinase inhibitor-like protein [bacterium]|nr:YbhB/YbcL family Raf kinase inhibitor-like protein [bacterium]